DRHGVDTSGRRDPLRGSGQDAGPRRAQTDGLARAHHAGIGRGGAVVAAGPGAAGGGSGRLLRRAWLTCARAGRGDAPGAARRRGGVAIATGLASLVFEVPVRSDLAMTGEVTLTGKVLAVGGVRQKVLAAFRAGIREVVLPSKNMKDLDEVPPEVLAKMRFRSVDTVDEVLRFALVHTGRIAASSGARLARTRARRTTERRIATRS